MDKELVVLTGVSGAGKSTAMKFLEDVSYYCIDNMPPQLMGTFVGLLAKSDEYSKVALVTDVRSRHIFQSLIDSIEEIENYGYIVKVIYLDINDKEALKRYKLTRRKHPFADKFSGSISQAIAYEKEILSPLRARADHVIDTSDLDPAKLRKRLTQILLGDDSEVMNIHCMSFGFKHGIPSEADFVIDVRCLPNPYWVESLRDKTGLDSEVKNYVFSFDESHELLKRLIDMLDFLNPLYIKEGKSQFVIAVGCTGGNHRSVAIAEALKEHFSKKWDNVSVNHRDIDRK
ncbi:MAG TPA: RNase adapter RapZ [Candidatus Eubacterium faecigallinarum]|nr:RNase adapter RapZ [Candidatus Eubacterium faecigallinarum]